MSATMSRLAVAAVLAGAAFTSALLAVNGRVSRREAELLKKKIATITQFGERRTRQTHKTSVTEDEVNAYLMYDARDHFPPGVVDPSVSILGTGRISARAVVDLDAVHRQKNPTSPFDPMIYLTGRVPLVASGVLRTSNGLGRFELEVATVAGVAVPKVVLQEIVSYYSRTPQSPAGLNLDSPFALPARIREIQVERGLVIIVQ